MIHLVDPAHPGEVLKELFLDPLGMSAGKLAGQLRVPRTRIERLVKGETALTPDTALRLSRFFGNTAEFWMNLQYSYELEQIRRELDVSAIEPLQSSQAA
ncbi:HigA family addiction module antidote protein [Mesorhizobium microcysteis]|uniref:HigA family addiction module antidote protein n=1 Tax=Neoaquamicrobium microcysteis TaxID=2682781 RepID=A0A5D4GUG7_9HYPH|nr:HigA family addiction module antitoxin [Mesorhizobium microcysteis]TYR30935.1 HigA family addiction module antidote protein [Mesorhizobium microcysteis]